MNDDNEMVGVGVIAYDKPSVRSIPTTKPISVYLAGGMRTNWQEYVENAFADYDALVFISPMYNNVSTLQEIVGIDLFGVKQCDIVFAYLEESNPAGHGMMVELGYAKALGKTIIFVNEQTEINEYTTFANELADVLSESLNSAVITLSKMVNMTYRKIPSSRIT